MQKFEELEYGRSYHIYNKGINGSEIFNDSGHYEKFLLLYEKHIDPVVETFAWCLMKNHFHFLLRVKDEEQIQTWLNKSGIDNAPNNDFLSRRFSNFFNAYAQSFNFRTKRTGGLFQTPFKRKVIDNDEYFTTLIYYIHNNPVKHGICLRMQDYPWSSYATIISFTPTKLQRDKVIGWFEGKNNFIAFHKGQKEQTDILPLIY